MARRWEWGKLDAGTALPALVQTLNERLKALAGSFNFGTARTVQAVTAAVTLGTMDDLCTVNATSAPVVVTLPAARAGSGATLTVIKTDASANAVTVTPAGSDTVGGAATWPLTAQNQSVTLVGDGGTNWLVVGGGPAVWA